MNDRVPVVEGSKAKKVLRRCLGGAVAIAILATIVVVDRGSPRPWIAVSLTSLLGVIGALEFFAILEIGGMKTRRALATLGACGLLGVTVATVTTPFAGFAIGGVIALWLLLAFAAEVIEGDPRAGIERVAFGALGIGYVWLYSFLLWILLEPVGPRGVELALWLVFVSKSNDIGGFLVGNLLGGRKLAPRVSPGKTWSGSLGGMALSQVATFAGAHWIGVSLAVPLLVLFSLAVSIATQFGDLAESLLKRACQVKDSGRLLPTFGGALDVIDSLAFAAPVGYAFLRATGALS